MSDNNSKITGNGAANVEDPGVVKQTDRARKDHDERVKMIRERHEQEHERRLAELRAAEERGEKLLRSKEAERERRTKEMKEREIGRRHAVEERRKQLEMNDNEKRQQILARYDVVSANNIVNSNSYNNSPTARSSFRQQRYVGNFTRNHPNRSTYAFGSSTPRTLTYLENLDPSMKLYNTRLLSKVAGHDDDTSSMTTSMCSQRTNVSGFGRRSVFNPKIPPTALTMCTKAPAGFVCPSNRNNDLTSPSDISFASSCMTTSFALGDSPSVIPLKNVRRQNHFSSTFKTDRNNVASRARPPPTTQTAKVAEKIMRTSKIVHDSQQRNDSSSSSTMSKPPPRPPPPTRNKITHVNGTAQNKKLPTTTKSVSKEKSPRVLDNGSQNGGDVISRFADENVEISMNSATITANFLNENVLKSFHDNVIDVITEERTNLNGYSNGEPSPLNFKEGETLPFENDEEDSKELTSSNSYNLLSASTAAGGEVLSSVPTPTGKNLGKSLTMEEAKTALAERRRLAREQLEREKELEKQLEEQKRQEEEEMLRREEEQFRLQEEEERRILDDAKKADELRLQLAIEEQRRRREEEERSAEEEKQRADENEAKAREMEKRLEKEREEKLRKEEEERLERKKKLDAIMQRTRQSVSDNGNNNNASSSGDESSTTNKTSSDNEMKTSVMKKFTDDVGRSVGSILNRVRSTTKADKTLITKSSNANDDGQTMIEALTISTNATSNDDDDVGTGVVTTTISNVPLDNSSSNSNGFTTNDVDLMIVNNHNNNSSPSMLVDLNNINFDINANNLDVDQLNAVDGSQRNSFGDLLAETFSSSRIENVTFNDTAMMHGSATTKASSGDRVTLAYNDIINENVEKSEDDSLMHNQNLLKF